MAPAQEITYSLAFGPKFPTTAFSEPLKNPQIAAPEPQKLTQTQTASRENPHPYASSNSHSSLAIKGLRQTLPLRTKSAVAPKPKNPNRSLSNMRPPGGSMRAASKQPSDSTILSGVKSGRIEKSGSTKKSHEYEMNKLSSRIKRATLISNKSSPEEIIAPNGFLTAEGRAELEKLLPEYEISGGSWEPAGDIFCGVSIREAREWVSSIDTMGSESFIAYKDIPRPSIAILLRIFLECYHRMFPALRHLEESEKKAEFKRVEKEGSEMKRVFLTMAEEDLADALWDHFLREYTNGNFEQGFQRPRRGLSKRTMLSGYR